MFGGRRPGEVVADDDRPVLPSGLHSQWGLTRGTLQGSRELL